MKVVLYARVSTEGQDPYSQMPRLEAWAQAHGHEVVARKIEVASTRLTRRPVREEALALVRGRHAAGIAVCKLDRWGRSVLDISTSLQELDRLGVKFYAIENNIALEGKNDPMGAFLLHILAAVAELERSLISERTKAAMAYVRDVKKQHVGRPRKGGPKTDTPVPAPEGGLERVPFLTPEATKSPEVSK